jgi:transposase
LTPAHLRGDSTEKPKDLEASSHAIPAAVGDLPPSCSEGSETLRGPSSPRAVVGELEADARRAAVLGLVAALEPIVQQISQLTSQIAGAVRAHPDGSLFLAFFRDRKSVVTAAGLLAEIGDNHARYPTKDSLAADAGQAPVTIQSGKRAGAGFRWACDKRLRGHVGVLADSTRHWHPWAKDVYQRARRAEKGLRPPHWSVRRTTTRDETSC